jgi:hypothetical protein
MIRYGLAGWQTPHLAPSVLVQVELEVDDEGVADNVQMHIVEAR